MSLKIEATYVCDWVRENNGVVQSVWVPAQQTSESYPVYMNTPRENGVPRVGEIIQLRAL